MKPYKLTLYQYGAVYNQDTFDCLEKAIARAYRHVDEQGGSDAIILDKWNKFVMKIEPNPQLLS